MNASQRIIAYVLEQAGAEPTGKRAALYRDLSTLVQSDESARELMRLSVELESIELREQQLRLDLGEEAKS